MRLFFILLMIFCYNIAASSNCSCDSNKLSLIPIDEVLEMSPAAFEKHLSGLDRVYRCRKQVGIFPNYCAKPLYLRLRSTPLDSVSQNEYELLKFYQRCCYEFQEELDYPVNVIKDSVLPALQKYPRNKLSEREVDFYHLLKDQAQTMVSDLEEEVKEYEEEKWQKSFLLSEVKTQFDQPIRGKPFLIAGCIAVPVGIAGTILSARYLNKLVETHDYEGCTPGPEYYVAFISFFVFIAVDAGSLVLLTFGSAKEAKYKQHIKERNCFLSQ